MLLVVGCLVLLVVGEDGFLVLDVVREEGFLEMEVVQETGEIFSCLCLIFQTKCREWLRPVLLRVERATELWDRVNLLM